jgi:hypothetical protein
MKRFVASLWICWAAYCGYQSNTTPLAFGMTLEEAAVAHDGFEIYVAYGQAGLLRAYPVASVIALQFRSGRLTGWKKDWRLRQQ